jgi:DNA-binding transcriptional regulator YdaS (Cro superfamily)
VHPLRLLRIRFGLADYIQKGCKMESNTRVNYLVTNAAKISGSYAKLARELAVAPQTVNNWRSEEKPCPPEYRAAMAKMLGEDATAELTRASLERHAGTPRYAALARYMGGHVLATGGPLALTFTAAVTSWVLIHMEGRLIAQTVKAISTALVDKVHTPGLLDTMYIMLS